MVIKNVDNKNKPRLAFWALCFSIWVTYSLFARLFRPFGFFDISTLDHFGIGVPKSWHGIQKQLPNGSRLRITL